MLERLMLAAVDAIIVLFGGKQRQLSESRDPYEFPEARGTRDRSSADEDAE